MTPEERNQLEQDVERNRKAIEHYDRCASNIKILEDVHGRVMEARQISLQYVSGKDAEIATIKTDKPTNQDALGWLCSTVDSHRFRAAINAQIFEECRALIARAIDRELLNQKNEMSEIKV